MYHIGIDVIRKYIIIEVSGHMTMNEVQEYVKDLTDTIYKYEDKELSMLIMAQRMDPLSQECLPTFKEAIRVTLTRIKKMAVVHTRFVTQMQMRRIEEEVCGELKMNCMIRRFKTKREAMNYLNDEDE